MSIRKSPHTDAYAAAFPAAPCLPWKRRTPRRETTPDAPELGSLREVFAHDKPRHGWKYPAGRKARRVIRGRGLKVAPEDEAAMRRHIGRCVRGMA